MEADSSVSATEGSATVGAGLGGIVDRSDGLATDVAEGAPGSDFGGAVRPGCSDDPAAVPSFKLDRAAGATPVDALCTAVGSSVTAMMRETASVTSAQDRAVTRRGAGFSPMAAMTISATTVPSRGVATTARAVYAASSTKRMRDERAATATIISFREVQSGLASTSSRTSDTSAGPTVAATAKRKGIRSEISTTLTKGIARDGSISGMVRAVVTTIAWALATIGGTNCGGKTIRLGDGQPDGGSTCRHGQIKASEVIWIGDTWITLPGTQHDGLRDLARAAGALGDGEDYVLLAQAAKNISQIADQYNTQESSATKVKVILMNGGGWDLIGAGGSDAAVSSVVSTFTQFLTKVASDGTVQHIIYFLYPELPTTPNVAGLRPGVRTACAQSEVPCHFLDLQPFWAGHAEYTAPDGVQASAAGGQVIANQIWAIMQSNCVAQ